MIPQRFVTEYPERCRQLLDMLEPQARQAQLADSFALLIASAAFNIPFARMAENRHPLGRPQRGLAAAVKALRKVFFLEAPFWNGQAPAFFRYASIVNDPEYAAGWRDERGEYPIRSMETKNGDTILRLIRNAIAHGNVVYLYERGEEAAGRQLRYLAFLSRNEDEASYRVAIFGEEDFLAALKAWIGWVQTFPPEANFAFLEAAE